MPPRVRERVAVRAIRDSRHCVARNTAAIGGYAQVVYTYWRYRVASYSYLRGVSHQEGGMKAVVQPRCCSRWILRFPKGATVEQKLQLMLAAIYTNMS